MNWTNQGTNILGRDFNTNWENSTWGCIAVRPVIIGGRYYLYYSSGTNGNDKAIGLAVSTNGYDFTKSTNNPIFSIYDGLAWRDDRTYTPCLVWYSSMWMMYYTGRATTGGVYSVGMATATN